MIILITSALVQMVKCLNKCMHLNVVPISTVEGMIIVPYHVMFILSSDVTLFHVIKSYVLWTVHNLLVLGTINVVITRYTKKHKIVFWCIVGQLMLCKWTSFQLPFPSCSVTSGIWYATDSSLWMTYFPSRLCNPWYTVKELCGCWELAVLPNFAKCQISQTLVKIKIVTTPTWSHFSISFITSRI